MDKILRINLSAEGGPQATAVPVGEYSRPGWPGADFHHRG